MTIVNTNPTNYQAVGTFTTSSATAPADTGRLEATDYWVGSMLIPLTGVCAFQARQIKGFTVTTGVFSIDADRPFTAAPGLVAYAIVPFVYTMYEPTADSTSNVDMNDVIGNKTDTANTTADGVSSLMRYIKGILSQGNALKAGTAQEKATTIDLNQAAASYTLFTGTTQPVMLQSLVIRMSGGAVAGAVTSISIQTNDATPQILVTAAQGAVANLTDKAQLGWTGVCYLATGVLIQLTIAGGAAGVAKVCDGVCEYRAIVSGGYLA